MGGQLDTPVVEKESDHADASGKLRLAWGASCMQGWRPNMEDAHICLPSLAKEGIWSDVAMFGVMDGHGGEQVARFAEKYLPQELCAYQPPSGSLTPNDWVESLTKAFHRIDCRLEEPRGRRELSKFSNPKSSSLEAGFYGSSGVDPNSVGCTCCITCLTADKIIVANAGDSRAVLCRAGKAVGLSEDHKPNDPGERKRIEKAGGRVEKQLMGPGSPPCYRVNGNLNLSRALGDLEYKQGWRLPPEAQIISGIPDVELFDRTDSDEFLVICCDGIWDMKTNQQVVDFVRSRLQKPNPASVDLARTMEELMDDCLSHNLRLTKGLGGDNMTAVIVWLKGTLQAAHVQSSTNRLIEAKLSKITPEPHPQRPAKDGGVLQVWVDLHMDDKNSLPRLDDIVLWVCPQKSQLSVSIARGRSGSRAEPGPARPGLDLDIQLGDVLAAGARLEAIDPGATCAKLYRRSSKLCVRLPWCQTNVEALPG